MDFDIDEEEEQLDTYCPNCRREYDEIDYEYQICHWCRHQNDRNARLVEK